MDLRQALSQLINRYEKTDQMPQAGSESSSSVSFSRQQLRQQQSKYRDEARSSRFEEFREGRSLSSFDGTRQKEEMSKDRWHEGTSNVGRKKPLTKADAKKIAVKEVKISLKQVGLVIGKSGETINMIQEQTGTKLKFKDFEEVPNSPFKTLVIAGMPVNVQEAVALIEDLKDNDQNILNKSGRGHQGTSYIGHSKPLAKAAAQNRAIQEPWAKDVTQTRVFQEPWAKDTAQNRFIEQPLAKDAAQNRIVHEVHVPTKLVGRVIGKSGENINMIQDKTGTKLQFRDNEDELNCPFKTCLVAGLPASVLEAVDEIQFLIDNDQGRGKGRAQNQFNFNKSGHGNEGTGYVGIDKNAKDAAQREVTHEVRVPSKLVGKLVGKGGGNIKMIQIQTGTHIQVKHEGELFDSSFKTCVVSGPANANVLEAVDSIQALIEHEESIEKGSNPNEVIIEVRVPMLSVGRVIGKYGETIKMLESQTGAKIQFKERKEEMGLPYRTCVVAGLRANVQKAVKEIDELKDFSEVKLPIPKKFVGAVMGKNGKTINWITAKTGTIIKMVKAPGDPIGDLCVVTGLPPNVEMAVSLIKEKMEEEHVLGNVPYPDGYKDEEEANQTENTAFVKGIPAEYTIQHLKELFHPHQHIQRVHVVKSMPGCPTKVAFVQLDSRLTCENFVETYHGMHIPGTEHTILVRLSDSTEKQYKKEGGPGDVPAEGDQNNKKYLAHVKGIPAGFTWIDFRDALEPLPDHIDVGMRKPKKGSDVTTAVVHLKSLEACARFVRRYDGKVLRGTQNLISVTAARDQFGPGQTYDPTTAFTPAAHDQGKERHTAYVTGIPAHVTQWHVLKDAFKPSEDIVHVRLLPLKPGDVKKSAVITLNSHHACDRLVRMYSGKCIPGTNDVIHVELCSEGNIPSRILAQNQFPQGNFPNPQDMFSMPPGSSQMQDIEHFDIQIKGLPGILQNKASVQDMCTRHGVVKHVQIIRDQMSEKIIAYVKMMDGTDCRSVIRKLNGIVPPGGTEALKVEMVKKPGSSATATSEQNVPVLSQKDQLMALVGKLSQLKEKQQGQLDERMNIYQPNAGAGQTQVQSNMKSEMAGKLENMLLMQQKSTEDTQSFQQNIGTRMGTQAELLEIKRREQMLEAELQKKEHQLQMAKKLQLLKEAEQKQDRLKREIEEKRLAKLHEERTEILNTKLLDETRKRQEKLQEELQRKDQELMGYAEERKQFELNRKRTSSSASSEQDGKKLKMNSGEDVEMVETTDQEGDNPVAGVLAQAIIAELKNIGIQDIDMVPQILEFIGELPLDCLRVLASSPVELLYSFSRVNPMQILLMSAAVPELNSLMQQINLDHLIALLQAVGPEAFHSLANQFAANPDLLLDMRNMFSKLMSLTNG